jgi:hypothetical protein
VRIDVRSASEARGVVYVTAYVAPKEDGVARAPPLTPTVLGQYVDRYRKTTEGWRFGGRAFIPLISKAPDRP